MEDFREHFGGHNFQVGVSRFCGRRLFLEAVVCLWISSFVFRGRRPSFEVVVRFLRSSSVFCSAGHVFEVWVTFLKWGARF